MNALARVRRYRDWAEESVALAKTAISNEMCAPVKGSRIMPKLTNGLNQPECPKCGTAMMLTRVVPDEAGLERRSFECPMCEHLEEVLVNSVVQRSSLAREKPWNPIPR